MRDWRPYKASKAEVLAFFKEKGVVTIRSLMDRFGYAYKGAQSRIYLLCNEGLIEHLIERGTWGLTTKIKQPTNKPTNKLTVGKGERKEMEKLYSALAQVGVVGWFGTLIIVGTFAIIGILIQKDMVSAAELLPVLTGWVSSIVTAYFVIKSIKSSKE